MRTGFILVTSLVIVAAFVPWTRSQGSGSRDSMRGLGPSHPSFGTALIDDTKGKFSASQVESVGRYSIRMVNGELREKRTGLPPEGGIYAHLAGN